MRLAALAALALPAAAAYDFSEWLSDDFQLQWSFTDDDQLAVSMRARTTGWVGLGFGSAGSMLGADIGLGWVDADGVAHVSDRFASEYATPPADASQDVTLVGGSEDGEWTEIEWTRPLASCDTDADVALSAGDTQRVVFAFGAEDPADGDDPAYHHQNRGSVSIRLFDYLTAAQLVEDESLQHFDLTVDAIEVEAYPGGNYGSGTTYYCQAFEIPDTITEKEHLVLVEPLVQADNVGRVHHILLYSCPDLTAEDLTFAGFCNAANMPDALSDCNFGEFVAGWAVGGGNFTMPDEAGFPVGPDHFRYALMEVHYDNPDGAGAMVDSSGLRLHHTPVLREYDAGALVTGHVVNTLPDIAPGLSESVTDCVCPSGCTSRFSEPLTVFGGLLHMHTAGAQIGAFQMRDNEQVAVIASDSYYDFNLQVTSLFAEPLTLEPGDEIVVRCVYDTSDRTSTTVGGESTDAEMCLWFAFYYPVQSMTGCVQYSSLIGACIDPSSSAGYSIALIDSSVTEAVEAFTVEAPSGCVDGTLGSASSTLAVSSSLSLLLSLLVALLV